MDPLRIATRGSDLALWQANHVADLLRAIDADLVVELRIVETTGDKRTDVPIHTIGGKGVFVKEVQRVVLDGHADLAVHSAKDLPSVTADGLVLAAVPERGDPRDCLVGARLNELPTGSHIATGSIRRRVQLAGLRPDLMFSELRGNIGTRLAKAADFDAIVMAAAALERLGETPEIVDVLEPDVMIPQVGQGALAIECRTLDERTRSLLAEIDDRVSRRAVDAERAYLAELGGDCDLPAGAYAVVAASGRITLSSYLQADDGSHTARHVSTGDDPAELGVNAARRAQIEVAHTGSLPLAGRRIVVTRSRSQASKLAQGIEHLGGDPVEIPTIEIVAPTDGGEALRSALAQIDQYQWVVVTSPNGAARLGDELGGRQLPSALKIAAVGPSTRDRLAEVGLNVDLMPGQFVGEGLVDAFRMSYGNDRVLLAQAEIARPTVRDGLAAKGWVVDVVAAYKTVAPDIAADSRRQIDGADAITFTSSSTVENYLDAVGRAGMPGVVACIGPVTADTARAKGLNVTLVAEEHTIAGLLAGLVAHFSPS